MKVEQMGMNGLDQKKRESVLKTRFAHFIEDIRHNDLELLKFRP